MGTEGECVSTSDQPTPKKPKVIEDSTNFTENQSSSSEIKLGEEESTEKNEAVNEFTNINNEIVLQMSKRQLKKLRKLKEFEERKKEKRLKEREKCKQRREEAAAKGLPTRIGPSRKELKRNKMENTQNFLTVAIDLDFDDLMIDRDICKCVKQLLRIYTINRRSGSPCKLFFTGIKEHGNIYKVLERHEGYQNWDVQWHFKPYTDVFDKDKIVYLTSDSDNVITKLEEDNVYIIGGIVDHNHHKGLCYERAQKLALKTARLPLSEYVDLKTRSVLSTVHVFEIILQISLGKEWSKAILETLPARKGAKPRNE